MNDFMLKAWIAMDAHAQSIGDSIRRRKEEGADLLEWLGGMALVLAALGAVAVYLSNHGDDLGQAIVKLIKGLIGDVTDLGQQQGGNG